MRAHEIAPTNKNLSRYAPSLMTSHIGISIMGVWIWVVAWLWPESPGMAPETWGELAYYLSAEFWGAGFMLGGAFSVLGLIYPPRRWVVVLGNGMLSAMLLTAALSCFFFGGDNSIGAAILISIFPAHGWVFLSAIRHASNNT